MNCSFWFEVIIIAMPLTYSLSSLILDVRISRRGSVCIVLFVVSSASLFLRSSALTDIGQFSKILFRNRIVFSDNPAWKSICNDCPQVRECRQEYRSHTLKLMAVGVPHLSSARIADILVDGRVFGRPPWLAPSRRRSSRQRFEPPE